MRFYKQHKKKNMSARSIILLVIAAVIAFGASQILRQRLSADTDKADGSNAKYVLVAAQEITQGSFVRDDKHFEWVEWPDHMLQDSYMVKGQSKPEDYNGAVARRSVMKGEPISSTYLVKSNEGGFMSAVLQPNMRAVSIAVDSTTGNAGFIFPGDKVDLIVTHAVDVDGGDGGRGKEVLASKTFVEDARVLAVDQRLDNPENKAILAKTVTLEVTSKEAEKINVAKEMGNISVSLRSLASENELAIPSYSYTRDSDVSPILAPTSRDASPTIAPTRNSRRVRVFRGAEQEEKTF